MRRMMERTVNLTSSFKRYIQCLAQDSIRLPVNPAVNRKCRKGSWSLQVNQVGHRLRIDGRRATCYRAGLGTK